MGNLLKNGAISIAALIICFSFAGCATTGSLSVISGSTIPSGEYDYIVINRDGVIMQASIAQTRDFTTLGLVFVETSATFDSNGNIIEGSIWLYDMLMREAEKLGADDIINLKVDEIQNISVTEEIKMVPTRVTDTYGNPQTSTPPTPTLMETRVTDTYGNTQTVNKEMRVQTQTKTVHYKANALAIKYTGFILIPESNSTRNTSNTGDVNNTQNASNAGGARLIPSIIPGR